MSDLIQDLLALSVYQYSMISMIKGRARIKESQAVGLVHIVASR